LSLAAARRSVTRSAVLQAVRFALLRARRADPSALWTVAGLQIGQALLLALQIVLGKRALDLLVALQSRPGTTNSLLFRLSLFVGAGAISGVMTELVQVRQRRLGERVQAEAWDELLELCSRVPLERFEEPGFHDLVDRARISAFSRTFTLVTGLVSLISGVTGAVVVGAAVVYLQPLLVPLLLLGALLIYLVNSSVGRAEFEFAEATTSLVRRRLAISQIQLGRTTAREVRSFGAGRWLRLRHRDAYAAYQARLEEHLVFVLKLRLVGAVMSAAALMASLTLLVVLLKDGRLSLALAGAALLAVRLLGGRLQAVAQGISALQEGALFVQDWRDFLAAVPDDAALASVPPTSLALLHADGLSYRYPGASVDAVAGINLELLPGQVVALVGANGSGKSTLARLLGQVYVPGRGQLFWNGTDVLDLDRDDLRQMIAVVPQDFGRFALTLRDNLLIAIPDAVPDDARLQDALAGVGLERLAATLPSGLETPLDSVFPGGVDLSLGQWQRIALARAFLRNAEVVILDEPTASLDAQGEARLYEEIRTLMQGRAVVLISHRYASVRNADRIYVLDHGHVVEKGTHAELMKTAGKYAAAYELQASMYR
jgi:ATP-binding cassette subfamily B protein